MNRPLLSSPLFWVASAGFAVAIGFGCSSSSSGPATVSPDGSTPNDTGTDAGPSGDTSLGDGAHDGGAPDALYGACAVKGGFGWPCTAAASGADPTECTDPKFSQCFVGGQGSWCTATCVGVADCTNGASDAGCIPTACNGRGFCK